MRASQFVKLIIPAAFDKIVNDPASHSTLVRVAHTDTNDQENQYGMISSDRSQIERSGEPSQHMLALR